MRRSEGNNSLDGVLGSAHNEETGTETNITFFK